MRWIVIRDSLESTLILLAISYWYLFLMCKVFVENKGSDDFLCMVFVTLCSAIANTDFYYIYKAKISHL